jgi:hypothetical protein
VDSSHDRPAVYRVVRVRRGQAARSLAARAGIALASRAFKIAAAREAFDLEETK